ncbi:MDR family MFS transporter [Streptomyces capparidis]
MTSAAEGPQEETAAGEGSGAGGSGRGGGTAGGGGRESPRDAEGAAPGGRRAVVVLALMLTMTLAAVDTTMVSTAVPHIVADVGGFTMFSWVFSAYLLAQTVTIPVYGKLSDLYGRKPVLIAGTTVFLIGSALCTLAWDMPSLIVFRAVQGLGAGAIQATVLTLAADLYPLKERGRIQAALSTVWGTASVAGPSLGGVFAEYLSWRWIFLINLPVGAVALLLISRHLRERVRRSRARVDWAGAVLMLGAGVTLILALVQGGVAWSWRSAPSVGLLSAAAVLTALTVVVERRVAEPVMPPWIWTRRVLVGVNLSHLCIGVIMIGPSVFLPVYAQEVLGLGAVQAGLVTATMTMSWPLAAALSSRLYLRIGFRDTALIGAVLAAAAALWVQALPYRPPLWQLVGATLLLGAGLGLFSPTTTVGAQSTVGHWQRGTVTASVVFSRYLGQSLGAAVLGAVSNAALASRLSSAPESLRERLPERVDDIGQGLGRESAVPEAGADYLRHALDLATHRVYLGVAVACGVALLLLVLVVPREFPRAEDDRDGTDRDGADRDGADGDGGGPDGGAARERAGGRAPVGKEDADGREERG